MIILNPNTTREYIHSSQKDLPKEEQNVVTLKHLTVEEESIIMDSLYVKGVTRPYNQYAKAFEIAVIDISNLKTKDGEAVAFNKEIIESIPRSFRDAVACDVLKFLERKPEQVKNLQSSPS